MNANGDGRGGDQEALEEANHGCEFCRADFNRPDGGFTCPYCGAVWGAADGKEGGPTT